MQQAGPGPWWVSRNPGEPDRDGDTSSGSCSPRCLGPSWLRVIRWLLRKSYFDVVLTQFSKCWLSCSCGTRCVDNRTWSGWMACYKPCRRQPVVSPHRQADKLRHPLGCLIFFVCLCWAWLCCCPSSFSILSYDLFVKFVWILVLYLQSRTKTYFGDFASLR
jgi:hypothetical protein